MPGTPHVMQMPVLGWGAGYELRERHAVHATHESWSGSLQEMHVRTRGTVLASAKMRNGRGAETVERNALGAVGDGGARRSRASGPAPPVR